MDRNKLIGLGSCKKPHGLKGEVEFWTASGNDTHLEKGQRVWLFPSPGSALRSEGWEVELLQVRKGNNILLKFTEIVDRTALEKILPFEIYTSREQFPELDEGEHYVVDLLGLTAIDEDGKVVGKIADYYETPAQLVFTIHLTEGGIVDLPYLTRFFPDVDLDEGTVTVVLPEIVE